MARHRTFGVTEDAQEPGTVEPVTFTLEGGPPLSAQPWTETFTCLPVAPAGVLDDFLTAATFDATTGTRRWQPPSVMAFLRGVLVPDDVPRLDDLARDKDRIVETRTLGAVVMWLSDELFARPTTPPSTSPDGRQTTTPTS